MLPLLLFLSIRFLSLSDLLLAGWFSAIEGISCPFLVNIWERGWRLRTMLGAPPFLHLTTFFILCAVGQKLFTCFVRRYAKHVLFEVSYFLKCFFYLHAQLAYFHSPNQLRLILAGFNYSHVGFRRIVDTSRCAPHTLSIPRQCNRNCRNECYKMRLPYQMACIVGPHVSALTCV